MAFKTSVWTVEGKALSRNERTALDSESRLEDWIVADLSLLGEELLLIGRQIRTTGGPLDLLAIDAEGTLVIAELKRHRTPREIIAQALDYASWVAEQSPRNIEDLFLSLNRRPLADAFREKFDLDLPEDACLEHRMLIVAAELDDSSERIIRYLQEQHEIDINAVFFSVYQVNDREVLVRAWLADPIETHERAEKKRVRPKWSGIWYVNHTEDRDWEMRRKYGFISAGYGEKYSKPLLHLHVGDTVAVYLKRHGYLGVGTVRSAAVTAADYQLSDGRPLGDLEPTYVRRAAGKEELIVGIDWMKTVSVADAKTFEGAFANQNVVCKLRDIPTLQFLRNAFELKLPEIMPSPDLSAIKAKDN